MSSLGGDGFWLIHASGLKPFAIDASGRAAAEVSPLAFREMGFDVMPERGGKACVTVGGTVAGWQAARQALAGKIRNQASLPDLLAPAIEMAKGGVIVTAPLARASALFDATAVRAPGKQQAEMGTPWGGNGHPLAQGDILTNRTLADAFNQLAYAGLDDFFRGDLGHVLANGLQSLGSPIGVNDLQSYRAELVKPISVQLRPGRVYNLPPPAQGLVSLLILAVYDRLWRVDLSEVEQIHLLVEATKQALALYDRHIGESSRMSVSIESLLEAEAVDAGAKRISARAGSAPDAVLGDGAVWMGGVDSRGMMVSFVQSMGWTFGAGVAVPGAGIIWNNAGVGFSLNEGRNNSLSAAAKPLHALSAAYAQLKDGRRVVYGANGGDGQSQTQAVLFNRSFFGGESIAGAIERGRWVFGRTRGENSAELKVEEDLWQATGKRLRERGHAVAMLPELSGVLGHAGALILDRDGRVDGASDPRSEGRWMAG